MISDRIAARLQLAQAWGATATVDGRAVDAQDHLRAALPDGAACAIDVVGADGTCALALRCVRPGGRVDLTLACTMRRRRWRPTTSCARTLPRAKLFLTSADFAAALKLLEPASSHPPPVWI